MPGKFCDPFGVNLSRAIPYAYAGKRYNSESGLVYFGKRYYHPVLGRWLTPDPIGPLDHSNLYQYVFNNPFRYRDPTAQFAFATPLKAIPRSVRFCEFGLAAALQNRSSSVALHGVQ